MSLALAASSACKWEANWQVGTSTPVDTGQSAAAVENPTVTKAEMRAGSGAFASKFAVDTPEIVCEWEVDGVEAGTEILGAWVAVDTNGVAPANYKIDEAKLTLDGPSPGSFTLTKSMKAWPKGSYKVEIFLDGKLARTVPFTIA
jgi:hypothetical protein